MEKQNPAHSPHSDGTPKGPSDGPFQSERAAQSAHTLTAEALHREVIHERRAMSLGMAAALEAHERSGMQFGVAGYTVLKGLIDPAIEALERLQAASLENPKAVKTTALLAALGVEAVALIALRTLIEVPSWSHGRHGASLVSIGQRVGSSLVAEALCQRLMAGSGSKVTLLQKSNTDPDARLRAYLKRKNFSKRAILTAAKRYAELVNDETTIADKTKIGVDVVTSIVNECPKYFGLSLSLVLTKMPTYYVWTTPEYEQWVRSMVESHAMCQASLVPMIIPPKPWSASE